MQGDDTAFKKIEEINLINYINQKEYRKKIRKNEIEKTGTGWSARIRRPVGRCFPAGGVADLDRPHRSPLTATTSLPLSWLHSGRRRPLRRTLRRRRASTRYAPLPFPSLPAVQTVHPQTLIVSYVDPDLTKFHAHVTH